MSTAAARWEAALAAWSAGRKAEAEAAMRALVAAGDADAERAAQLARIVYNRAVEALDRDGIDAAEALLREALAFAPALPELRRGLVKLLFRRIALHETAGAWPTAAMAAWEIVGLSPEPVAAMGETVAALAQRMEARSVASVATDALTACRLMLAAWGLAGKNRQYYATTRSMFVHLGTGELGSPVDAAVFEALLVADSRDLVALLGLSNIHRRARRLHTAEMLCRNALEHWPENPFAEGRLASILVEQGSLNAADALFRKLGARYGGIEAVLRFEPAFLRSLPAVDAVPADEIAPLPAGAPDVELVVLAGGDAVYFHRFADALANSLALNCRALALHFHVVDPDPAVAERLQAMRQRLPGISIALTAETLAAEFPRAHARTYFACARFLQLPRLLAAYGRPILLLDIDMVVLRDVAPLLARFRAEQADLALVHGETREPWSALWADAILIAPTPRAGAYAAMVRDYIGHFFAQGEAAWFLDQVALFAARAAGFQDRAAPVVLAWPTDIQNTRTDVAYFWSLHMSQPKNVAGPESPFYRRFRENAP